MELKKIVASTFKQITKERLSMVQFRSKDASDCVLAKLLLNYRAIKNCLRKLLLIDISAAFDSVNRSKLTEIVARKIGSNAFLFLDLHEINMEMSLQLLGQRLIQRIGYSKGIPSRALSFACIWMRFFRQGALSKLL